MMIRQLILIYCSSLRGYGLVFASFSKILLMRLAQFISVIVDRAFNSLVVGGQLGSNSHYRAPSSLANLVKFKFGLICLCKTV